MSNAMGQSCPVISEPSETPLYDDCSNNWNNVDTNSSKQSVKPPPKEESDDSSFSAFFEALADRFVNQQDAMIPQRSVLITWFAWITAIQLLIINVLIFIAVFGPKESLSVILDFLKFFVGATFVELLGGLFIIVNFVFSHEASDMLKHLTFVEPNTPHNKPRNKSHNKSRDK